MSTKNPDLRVVGRRRQTAAEQALDANALELFARIAQAGSFAQAARDLGLTRAAISRRIAAIESAVGLALFARSTRSLGLTEAGRRLHARARAVRDAAESARLALRHTRDQLDGTLRISATAGFGRHVLAPLLALPAPASVGALRALLHRPPRRPAGKRDLTALLTEAL